MEQGKNDRPAFEVTDEMVEAGCCALLQLSLLDDLPFNPSYRTIEDAVKSVLVAALGVES